jgi:hypothetical protein
LKPLVSSVSVHTVSQVMTVVVNADLGAALAVHPGAATGSPMQAMKAMKVTKSLKSLKVTIKEGAARSIAKGASKARPAMTAPSVMKRAMKQAGMTYTRNVKTGRFKRPTVVATGIRARAAVFAGRNARTKGGLTKAMLRKNKRGKIVSNNASDASKYKFAKGLAKWNEAVRMARASLGTIGFVSVNGHTVVGKQIFQKAKQYYVRS